MQYKYIKIYNSCCVQPRFLYDMVFLFKNNDKLYLITVSLFVCLCFFIGNYFLNLTASDTCTQVKFNFFISGNIGKFFIFCALLFSVFYLNFLVQKHEITEKQNHFPGVFLALFSAVFLHSSELYPLFVSTVFFLGAIDNFLSIYREESSGPKIFNGSFMLGVAGIISPAYLLFLFIPFISLMIFKPFKFREWIFASLGILTPFVFPTFYFFMLDKNFLSVYTEIKHAFSFPHIPVFHSKTAFFTIITSAIFASAVLSVLGRKQTKKIKSQKSRAVFIWIFIFSIPGLFFAPHSALIPFVVSVTPISVFLGDFTGTMKKNFLAGLLFTVLFASFLYLCWNFNS